MTEVKTLQLKERISNSIDSRFGYNLTSYEDVHEDIAILKDGVIAIDDIPRNTNIYEGTPIMSYREHGTDDNIGLLCGVSLISKEHIRQLLDMTETLYPRTEKDIDKCIRFLYPDLDDEGIEECKTRTGDIFTSYFYFNEFETESDPKYRCLYISASMFDHSCSPNCMWQIIDKTLYINTNRNIKAGEKLTISYSRSSLSSMNRNTRRTILKDVFNFDCRCNYCTNNKTHSRCILCGSEKAPFTCSRCKKVSYCSKQCQKHDWNRFHKSECTK